MPCSVQMVLLYMSFGQHPLSAPLVCGPHRCVHYMGFSQCTDTILNGTEHSWHYLGCGPPVAGWSSHGPRRRPAGRRWGGRGQTAGWRGSSPGRAPAVACCSPGSPDAPCTSCCSLSGPVHMAGKKRRYKPSFWVFSARSCVCSWRKSVLQSLYFWVFSVRSVVPRKLKSPLLGIQSCQRLSL